MVRHHRRHQPQYHGPILMGARVSFLVSSHTRPGTRAVRVSAVRMCSSVAVAGPTATLTVPGCSSNVSVAVTSALPRRSTSVLVTAPSARLRDDLDRAVVLGVGDGGAVERHRQGVRRASCHGASP